MKVSKDIKTRILEQRNINQISKQRNMDEKLIV